MCKRTVGELRKEGVLLAVAEHLVSQMSRDKKEYWATVGMVSEMGGLTINAFSNLVREDGYTVRRRPKTDEYYVMPQR